MKASRFAGPVSSRSTYVLLVMGPCGGRELRNLMAQLAIYAEFLDEPPPEAAGEAEYASWFPAKEQQPSGGKV